MNKKMTLGLRLKSWRKQRKLTQEELAELIDMSVHAISAIERGVNFPSLKTIERISDTLEIPIIEFYDLNNNVDMTPKQTDKEKLIKTILGVLYKLNDKDLEIILKQVGAFDFKKDESKK